MKALIISKICSEDKNLEILFKACNFRFAFLYTVLRCSVKSSLLSIMTRKSFSEALFLIVMFLTFKVGQSIRCFKSHKVTFVRTPYTEVVKKPFVLN